MIPDERGPRTSVILATCNGADGLPAAIDSILQQTDPDLELVIVDDGSTDTTPDLLDGFTDPRIVRIRLPEPSGTARACNAGISASRGKWIGFISSGDTWDVRKLEEQGACISRLPPESGVVYSDAWEITAAGNRAYRHAPAMTGPDLLNGYATGFQAADIGTGPLLVRRSFLDLAGPFDEQLRWFSDTDMIIRLQRLCRFHHIGKPLYHSRSLHALAADPIDRSISSLLLLRKYPEALENPVFVGHQLDAIGRSLRQARAGQPVEPARIQTEPERDFFRQPVPYS